MNSCPITQWARCIKRWSNSTSYPAAISGGGWIWKFGRILAGAGAGYDIRCNPSQGICSLNRTCRLLWPWPWPSDLDIQTWLGYSEDVPADQNKASRSTLSRVRAKQDRQTHWCHQMLYCAAFVGDNLAVKEWMKKNVLKPLKWKDCEGCFVFLGQQRKQMSGF